MAMVIDQAETHVSILISALAADVFTVQEGNALVATLKNCFGANTIEIAQTFNNSILVRKFRLANTLPNLKEINLRFNENLVIYEGQTIGKTQVLYKSPLPGELQARLAIESAIARFLEYLQKVYKIAVLNESDRHIQIFIPGQRNLDFIVMWEDFLQTAALSIYGITKHQIPGLLQSFVAMLNSVKLADRGFAPQDFPIVSKDQVHILSAWYYAVIQYVGERQRIRQNQIENLEIQLKQEDLKEKERKAKVKDLEGKQNKQIEESEKYRAFRSFLDKQLEFHKFLDNVKIQLRNEDLDAQERKTLERKEVKCLNSIYLNREALKQLLEILEESGGNPFVFLELDTQRNPKRFENVLPLVKFFTKHAAEQINSTTGANFTKCFSEIYRLLGLEIFAPKPSPVLTEKPRILCMRTPGDSGGEFCYSCSVELPPKSKGWQVARFIFERPSQRLQSSPSESRPQVCLSCFALAFASPLKVTEESIILKLEPKDSSIISEFKVKDYLRMLTNKEMHLNAGRYLVLTSDRTGKGDIASQKLGQVQYALAKVASIFPSEVLTDFKFSLVVQGNQIPLLNRQLLFLRGLIDCYRQSIIVSGKEINMALGDAVRHVQQDLPFLAEYKLTKSLFKDSKLFSNFELEQIRERFWKALKHDLQQQGDSMDSDNQLPKRARLYRDVAALTGLTYAFVQSLESTAKKSEEQKKDTKYTEREVSKIIEKVDDPVAFNYYATLGDSNKTDVQARLFSSPNNAFIYSQTQWLLGQLNIKDRDAKDEKGTPYIQLYADDISRVYQYFATLKDYAQDKDWKELTYNLKLSLYTRFPELVRKQKSTGDN